MANLTEKQLKIAELKAEGKSNKQIAKLMYPDAKEHAGAVLVSRELNKTHVAQYVEQGRDIALNKYGVTWDVLIAKLRIMLEAERTSNLTGELLPDWPTQLQALKQLSSYLDRNRTTVLKQQAIEQDEYNLDSAVKNL